MSASRLATVRTSAGPIARRCLSLCVVVMSTLFALAGAGPLPVTYEFSQGVRVNPDTPGVSVHNVAFTNGHTVARLASGVGVVWTGNQENSSYYHVYFSRSDDGGRTFAQHVRVDAQGGFYSVIDPALVCDGESLVYVCWRDDSRGTDHLYCSKSTDAGFSFGSAVRIDSLGGHIPQIPSLVLMQNGDLYCTWSAWQETSEVHSNIYLARSTNRGASFSPAAVVPSTWNVHSAASSIAGDAAGVVHLAWRDDRSDTINRYFHVYSCKSTDGGQTFTPAVPVDSAGPFSGSFPSLACRAEGDVVWCAYKARLTGEHHVYMAISQDSGATFAVQARLDSLGGSDTPNLEFRPPGEILVVWLDTRLNGAGDVYFAFSGDTGRTFSSGQRVNADTFGVLTPHVTAGSGDTIWVCWADRRNGWFFPDVYFARGRRVAPGLESESGRSVSQVSLEPNPARGAFRLRLSRSTDVQVRVSLYDVSGQLVWKLPEEEVSSRQNGIFVCTIPQGLTPAVYLCRWETAGASGEHKLVVVR